jgi:hypothetical protein
MKLYNDQRNAQVFKSIYQFTSALHVSDFILARLLRQVHNFGSGSSLLGMVSAPGPGWRQWFKSPGYGASARARMELSSIRARALTPYPGDVNHCRSCTPAYEGGLKESPNM